jgi:hypothetical protein
MKLDNTKIFGTDDYEQIQSQYEDMCHGSHRVKIPEDFELSEEEYACGKLHYGLMDIEAMSEVEFLDWLKVREEVLCRR